jgi:hypothetical protein
LCCDISSSAAQIAFISVSYLLHSSSPFDFWVTDEHRSVIADANIFQLERQVALAGLGAKTGACLRTNIGAVVTNQNLVTVGLSPVAVAKTLALVIFGLVFVHSLVLVCWKTQACGPAMFTINQFGYLFDLSREGNIPTWFSVAQLFSVAIALLFLTLTERARGSPVGAWWGLVTIFSYLSLDEATDMA